MNLKIIKFFLRLFFVVVENSEFLFSLPANRQISFYSFSKIKKISILFQSCKLPREKKHHVPTLFNNIGVIFN